MFCPSLRAVLAASFAGLCAFSCAATTLVVTCTQSDTMQQVVGSDLALLAERVAEGLGRDLNGNAAGDAASAAEPGQWVERIRRDYTEVVRSRYSGAELLVVSPAGDVLVDTDEASAAALPQQLLNLPSGTRVLPWLDGKPSLIGVSAIAAVPGTGDRPAAWHVLARKDLHRALTPVYHMRNVMTGVGLLLTCVAVGFGWWLAGVLARPFEALCRVPDMVPAPAGWSVRRWAMHGIMVREVHDCTSVLAGAVQAVRRQAQALRRQAAETRAIYEGTPLPLALLDPELRCIAASGALCTAFALPATVQGQTLPEMLGGAAGAVLGPVLRQVLATGVTVRDLELPVAGPDGIVANWMFSITPVRLDTETAQITGVSVAALNVTGRRVTEDQLRAQASTLENRVRERTAALENEMAQRARAESALIQAQRIDAVGQLTGGVAHDFNNLLTVVMSSLEMAEGLALDSRMRRLIRAAQGAATRGAKLTGQLLAFSRKQHLHIVPVELGEMLEGMKDLLRRTLGPGLQIQYRLCPELWQAMADRHQLELCVLNLAINARDASLTDAAHPQGGPVGQIVIDACNMSANDPDLPAELPHGDYAMISVTDQGCGMPADVLTRCMEPFFTTKPVGKGTGLGLSMVLGVAQQSGGTMGITSLPGHGTTVRVFLPRASVTVTHSAPDIRHPPGYGFPGLRVLLVDDDPDVREVTAAQLQEIGCALSVHADGALALQALAASPARFDMLVTDFAMPGMSGAELAEAARQLCPNLPVVLVTGFAELPDRFDRLTVLGKPYTGAELARVLRVALAENGQLTAM